MLFRGTHIAVTPNFIFAVLHVPRVAHPNYPSHTHLHTIFRDKLALLFNEMAMVWGDTLNLSTQLSLLKIQGSLIWWWSLFSHHSHTITPSLSLMLVSFFLSWKIFLYIFPSHMIVSMIDIYRDTATRDKLIFPLTITRSLTHLHFTIPSSPLFYAMGANSKESISRSGA